MELKDFLPVPDLKSCRSLLCIQPHPDDNEIGAGATIAALAAGGCKITYLTVTNGNMGSADPGVRPAEIAAKRRKEAMEAAEVLGVRDCRFLDYPDACFPDEKIFCRDILSVIREVRPEMVMTVDPYLPYEFHPDHLKTGMAVAQACLFSPFPHFAGGDGGRKEDGRYGSEQDGDGKEDKANKDGRDGSEGRDSINGNGKEDKGGNDGEDAEDDGRNGANGVHRVQEEPFSVKGIAFYSTAYPNTYINADETWDLKIRAIEVHKSQFGPCLPAGLKYYFEYKARGYGAIAGFERAEAFKVLTGSHLHMNVDTIRL